MTNQVTQTPTFLSEIFPLTIAKPNLACFRLTPEIERKDGNRLSFHLSRNLPWIVVIWNEPYFYALGMPDIPMPSLAEWKDILADVQEGLADFRDRYYSIQLVRQRQLTPSLQAQLAFQVLRKTKFLYPVVLSEKEVEVRREPDFWAEPIELNGELHPALTLTVHSSMLYWGNLEEFYQNHPYRQNPQTLLKDLKVRDIELGSYGTITQLAGTVGEHREKLINKATRESSKQALKNAADDQPLVNVQFKNRDQRHYAMAALRPCVTAETAERFEVDYGKLLKATKIFYKDRTNLLASYKQTAEKALGAYGIQVERSVNSRQYPGLFWQPSVPLEEIPLRFGKNFIGKRGDVLNGLSVQGGGGVYRRHSDYSDASRVIRIAAVKLCDLSVNAFLEEVKKRLKKYGFKSDIVYRKMVVVNKLIGADARAEVERSVDALMEVPPDIVLTFLPQSDRQTDKDEGGSLYYWVYSRLLRRKIASQVIYADTLSRVDQWKNILNQVIPGMLAKLGNLPFILDEPLEIADYFIGLDVARELKERLPGTVNACASVRLYDRQGKFIHYRIEDALIVGEEIPQRLLETLLPASELRGKTVLIYRDGSFCGNEVQHLIKWANAIGSKFILVECRKSCIPRLYNLNQKVVAAPEKGLALRLSSREAVVVTTKVSEKIGLARPLRLTVRTEGHQASIESIVETTLKLTLLHHGALQTPRLPMPLFGSDRMAYLRLNGIYPSVMEGDRQFWL
ncbi:stem cell self-renewal protein Piwi [Microcoleus sp. FACHB-831]|uniref:Piwi domain-containing protein n=1 Tax=Microcoleus sp. FACHB-831 TaxID=2692827 RepID=UPI0016862E51|nr:Piwi domain-containing protein [Microcoleus sp. FACHB-831]MBD1923892.1 stem cell self-renewal protein Piwi [Microcoleus sp. FACHB-831]